MRNDSIANAWVGVQDGCEITCALRQLIQVGSKALADLAATATKRAHGRHGHLSSGCCCQTAEPVA